jgi:alpha-tubulin suppressor-like RCC1 family protein
VSPYCATKTDGTLWCWPPQRIAAGPGAAAIDLATDWALVSSESGIACAVKTDGTLYCWGTNAAGQLGVPAIPDEGTDTPEQVGGDQDWVTTAVTVKVGCAVKQSGAVWCWGGNDTFTGFNGSDEPVEMQSPGPIAYAKGRVEGMQVVVEALAVDGTLWRWPAIDGSPTQIGARDDWHRASLGASHKCAIRSNGALHCWGSLLNAGVNPGDATEPTQVGTGTDWVEVETSEGTYLTGATCARDSLGDLYCLGHDGVGELGRGTIGSTMEPEAITSPGGTFVEIAAQGIQTCGTRADGTIACWGLINRWDNPGFWETSLRQVPDTVGTDTDWAEVSPGSAFTCARKTGGTAWCWGSLANGVLTPTGEPTQVGVDEDWTQVVSGYFGACGIRGGALHCWGTFSPWLGTNTDPTQVGTDTDWTEVDASVAVCGLRQGQLWCANGYRAHDTPEQLGDDSDWLTIAVSDADSCGIRGASLPGEIWCVLRATDIVYQMGNDADWIDVAAMKGGGTFEGFCGVRQDGTLWCWGMDFTESTGNPTMTSPTQFGTDTDYVAVATSGLSHACGLTNTGVVRCFGQAAGGALGNDRAWSIDPVGPVDLQ